MLITEKQKQKYMADTSAVAKLTNIQKYTEVRNVRKNDNEPYVLKDVFGSKNGLLKIAANLNKDMAKIYKVANNIRKKSIAPKYLSREYFNQLLQSKFITNHEHALIIGYEKKFKMLDKEIKELGKKIYKECKKKKLVLLGAATVGIGTAATIGMATAGAVAGGFLGAGSTILFLFPVALVFPLSIPIIGGICAIIGAVFFSTVSIGSAATIAFDEKDNAIIEDNKDKLVKEITDDLKKCQSKNLPGVPPHLLFVKDDKGNIGVPISHHLVAFEPQADIKELYDLYQKVTEEFDNDLKTTNIGLFLNSSFDAKDIKRCLKMYKDHSKLVETIVPMAKKLMEDLLKKHKNKTPEQDPKGWKESDKFVYYFAEYLSKLTYQGFNHDEIMQELKEKQSMQQAAKSCENIKKYMENLSQQPTTPPVDTSPVKAVSIEDSKAKTVTITPIQPSERELPSDEIIANKQALHKELLKVFESSPDDFGGLKGTKCYS